MHARPAGSIVRLAMKYSGDSWIRTDAREASAKSIMSVLTLAATSDKTLTILYKPKSEAKKFYKELGAVQYDGKPLLTRKR